MPWDIDIPWEELVRIGVAALAGAIIGFERELHDKPAGFRTMILISVGAALFTLMSARLAGDELGADRTRIAAQIVTGIGFLGAGAIIQSRGNVIGLTTAATIWVTASVGLTLGAGYYTLGLTVAVAAAVGLTLLGQVVEKLQYRRTSSRFHIRLGAAPAEAERIRNLITQFRLNCHSWVVTKSADAVEVRAVLEATTRRLDRFQQALLNDAGVHEFDRR